VSWAQFKVTWGSSYEHSSQPETRKAKSHVTRVPYGKVIRCKELGQVGQETPRLKSLEDELIISMTKKNPREKSATALKTSLHLQAVLRAERHEPSLEKLQNTLFEMNSTGRSLLEEQWILLKEMLTFNLQIWHWKWCRAWGRTCLKCLRGSLDFPGG